MNNIEVVSKGSLIGLAMVTVSSGITQIVIGKLIEGVILLVIGFGFVMWREYLKLNYLNKSLKKKKR